jgi:predicted nucleic acid-binding protein
VASALIDRVTLVELSPTVLERALEPFPLPVRTLDALHLASIEFLRRLKQNVELATYDQRLAAAARAMEISVIAL